MVAGSAASERQALSPSSWLQYGGWAAAVVAVATSLFLVANRSNTEDERLIADLTASHVRSMMATHLTDVASTDQHTVKPWFDGKLDFAPPVQDYRVAGFPLVGGRLDYISQRPVAALVYGRNKHYINLFIWPTNSQRELPAHASERNGYHVVRWSSGNMMYAAVSDLNESELQQFAKLWQDVR
jgi:anti-sigma factor RsiW